MRKDWGAMVFIGRDKGEHYQAVDAATVEELQIQAEQKNPNGPTIWARDAAQAVCGLFSEICVRVMQGQLTVSDIYPVFGSQLLRQSRPLRRLLDVKYQRPSRFEADPAHDKVRDEVQEWLIYHGGIRRRCLIFVDLLWAEAVRLEDLPPSEVKSAAEAKRASGKACRQRVFRECLRLNGLNWLLHARQLSRFLRHSEFRGFKFRGGFAARRLARLEKSWSERLLFKMNTTNSTRKILK